MPVHFLELLAGRIRPGASYEIEAVTKDFRGHVIPHIKVSINGKPLSELLDHGDTWKEGHFAFRQHDPGSRVEIRKVEVQELP
ncbi:MAG: hypothetical protein ACLQU5_22745 [Isosphaeraceae bacterium]